MTFLKNNAVAVIALLVAIIGCYVPVQAIVHDAGGVTNYDEVDATAIKIGGSSGSRIGPVIAGNGALIASVYTVSATSSAAMDIAVTGVVAGDTVFAQFGTTTPSAAGVGWVINGAAASTTSGFITVNVGNLTGAVAVVPQNLASSTGAGVRYLVIHPVTSVPGL